MEQRLYDARVKAGLDRMGALQNPTERQIARKMTGRIAAGMSPAFTSSDGVEFPARTVIDSIEWITGLELSQPADRQAITELFAAREGRLATLEEKLCEIALDTTYTDVEFVTEVGLVGDSFDDAFEAYTELKALLPAETVIDLQEHEATLATTVVQADRTGGFRAYAREVPDLMRRTHVERCSTNLAEN